MLGWRGRADEVTKIRGMFVHPRQVDEVAARFAGVSRYQVVVTRVEHQDVLTLLVEAAPGADIAALEGGLPGAIRDVMKLRGEAKLVPAGTIPAGGKKIEDQRKWE
jgi:phenylacetate-CoA ligase